MDSDMQFELVAASLRADIGDLQSFIEAFAVKLEGALPTQASVERKSDGLFSRTKHVHRIAVQLAENRYELLNSGGRTQTSVGRSVRGIVLKTEQVDLNTWIDILSGELTREAQRSDQARRALERILGA